MFEKPAEDDSTNKPDCELLICFLIFIRNRKKLHLSWMVISSQPIEELGDMVVELLVYLFDREGVFIGRGINYPVALEGALKLKEVSYIHAEGYAAGELKHGPFALLGRETPVVVMVARNIPSTP